MAEFSAQGLTRLKSRVSRAACGGSGEESASRLIQVVGSIEFLAGCQRGSALLAP